MSLTGKNVIVTGANAGIGYETALDLAGRGANIILACRNQAKAQEACDKIIEKTKNNNVEIEIIDLGDLKSIKEFSERIKAKWSRLDILINNAGLFHNDYSKTIDGFEKHFGTNYLGPYYLTRLLLDLIKNSEPSRIINVSSMAYKGNRMIWDDLQLEKKYKSFTAYGQSKLGNVLFTTELAKKLHGTNVTAVSLHPGFVDTEIFRSRDDQSLWTSLLQLTMPIARLFAKTKDDGAKTSVHCAVSDEVPSQTGSYFNNCKVEKLQSEGVDAEAAERLWKLSAEMVGLEP